MVTVMIYKIHI